MYFEKHLFKAKHKSGIEVSIYITLSQIHNLNDIIDAYEERNSKLFYHRVKISDLSDFKKQ